VGIEPRALIMLGQCSTIEWHPQPPTHWFMTFLLCVSFHKRRFINIFNVWFYKKSSQLKFGLSFFATQCLENLWDRLHLLSMD
jgi:hypothetical protein